jgi:hypothetical protein
MERSPVISTRILDTLATNSSPTLIRDSNYGFLWSFEENDETKYLTIEMHG